MSKLSDRVRVYGAAVLLAFAALLLAAMLDPLLDVRSPLIALVPAFVFAAWYGGIGPGLLATAICALLGTLLFSGDSPGRPVIDTHEAIRLAVFVSEGGVVSWLIGSRRNAMHALAQRSGELAESERRLRAILDNAPTLIYMKDLQGRMMLVNQQMASRFGVEPEEALGRTSREFVPAEHAQAHEANDRRVIQEGRAIAIEERAPQPDGEHTFISIKFPLRDDRGQIYGLCGISTDITDRKRAEESLRESEARARAVLDTAVDGILTINDRGVIETVNAATLKIFGYTREELIGQNVSILMPEPDRSRHDSYLQNYERTGQAKIIGIGREVLGRRKDGSTFPLDLSVGEVNLGQRRIYTGIVRDISQRKRAEQALRESSEELSAFFNTSSVGLVQLDPITKRFVRINDAYCALTGYSLEELRGMVLDDLNHPDDRERDVAALDSMLSGDVGAYTNEKRYIRKDGRVIWVHVTGTVIRDAEGRPYRTAAVVQDITQRKLAEEAMRELATTLEIRVQERTAELEAFSYTISHDLRAPLRAMQGFAQALVEDYGEKLDETGRFYASRITAAAGKMEQLIQDLLAYSRLNRAEIRLESIPLADAVAEAVDALSSDIARAGAHIDVPASLPAVYAHKATLGLAIQNLISNAIKFMPPDRTPSIRITASQQDGRTRVTVADNGLGIAPEHHERIFRVFERLHTDDRYPGTGIGLAIVRRAMERMGGQVGLESTPGQGSAFWIECPSTPSA